ncbi:MAG: flagellar filament capping protein FliD [Steroidobacteraceae bacterium]
MASITSTGIGSGLDISSLVQNLVNAEGSAKSTQLNKREAAFQAKLSAYGSFRAAVDKLRSALGPMQSEDGFAARTAASGSPDVFTATATSTAAAGSFDVEVERLATAQKLRSAPVATPATAIGTGTLVVTVGGRSLTLTIDSTNGTLAGIRDAINGAAGNPGVTATIVGGAGGAQLVLTSKSTGVAGAITVTQSGGDGGLSALAYTAGASTNGLTEVTAATDARMLVDGVAVTSASNTFAGVIDGVTLVAKSTSAPGETASLVIAADADAVKSRIGAFVSAYNALVQSMRSLTSYDAKTGTAGALLGDSTYRDFSESVRRLLSEPMRLADGRSTTLAELGITRSLDGTLGISDTRLTAALSTGFDDVSRMLADADRGLGTRLDALLERYVATGGAIDVRTRGLQASIDGIGEQRTALQERLAAYETRLRAQFNALDSLVSRLRSTGDFLTQQLSAISASTKANP